MKTFLVQHDFAKYQPTWQGDYVRKFGENNEGFTVSAIDLEHVKKLVREQHNLNPFYLKITLVER